MNDSLANSKLFTLLLSFSRPELKRLRKWIIQESERKDAVKLFLALYKQLSAKKRMSLSKETLHQLFYQNRSYNDSRIRYLLFEISRMCEQFIVYDRLHQSPLQRRLMLLSFYRERQIEKLFDEGEKQFAKELEQLPVRDGEYFFLGMQFHHEKNKYLKQKQKRNIEPNIQQWNDHLDLYYLMSKMSVYAEALNYKNLLKTDYNIRFIDLLLEKITDDDRKKYPPLRVQQLALQTLLEPHNEKHLLELKTSLNRTRHLFSAGERSDLYTLARNYCIKMINSGQKKFMRTLFELYQSELDSIRQEKQELSPAVFKNVITLALRLRETKWAYDFIRNYAEYLPAEQRESLLNFNLARYHFVIKQFNKAVLLLSEVNYPDFFLQLSAKALLLQTYYEMREDRAFDSLVHSFKGILLSKKRLGYHRNNYKNFIRFTEKLYRAEWLGKNAVRKLLGEIKKSKELVEREWLLEKGEELMKSPGRIAS